MGCDIHAYMEVRDGEGQPWRKIGKEFPYPYYSPERETKVYEDEVDALGRPYISNPKLTDDPIEVRNYDLFSVLADVRNGTGFAGVETGSRIEPLEGAPRGLPEDVTEEVKRLSDYWDSDGHSHSWCLLQELLDYDWDAPHHTTGVLPADRYDALKRGEEPTSWSGGVWGGGIVTVTEEQYEDFRRTGVLPRVVEGIYAPREVFPGGRPGPDTKIYVQARWETKGGVRGAVGESWPKKFEEWATKYDPKNTRLVFWFDN